MLLIRRLATMIPKREIIGLTDAARKQLGVIKTQHPDKLVRLSAEGGGCAGIKQRINTVDKKDIKPTDRRVDTGDETKNLIIDTKTEMYFVGTELDYTKDILGKQFRFNHDTTQLKFSCGCGESILPLNHKEIQGPISAKIDPCLIKHKKYNKK